jgi:hypothetical protein
METIEIVWDMRIPNKINESHEKKIIELSIKLI